MKEGLPMAAPLCYDRVTNCVNSREFTGLAEPENRRSISLMFLDSRRE